MDTSQMFEFSQLGPCFGNAQYNSQDIAPLTIVLIKAVI